MPHPCFFHCWNASEYAFCGIASRSCREFSLVSSCPFRVYFILTKKRSLQVSSQVNGRLGFNNCIILHQKLLDKEQQMHRSTVMVQQASTNMSCFKTSSFSLTPSISCYSSKTHTDSLTMWDGPTINNTNLIKKDNQHPLHICITLASFWSWQWFSPLTVMTVFVPMS